MIEGLTHGRVVRLAIHSKCFIHPRLRSRIGPCCFGGILLGGSSSGMVVIVDPALSDTRSDVSYILSLRRPPYFTIFFL